MNSPDNSVSHTGDDPDGTSSDGDDDESIIIDLTKINPSVQEILFVKISLLKQELNLEDYIEEIMNGNLTHQALDIKKTWLSF